MVIKVLAYITRGAAENREILVFRHRDFPEAGVQVVGGTVDANEDLEIALRREIEEESGLRGLEMVREIATVRRFSPHHNEWQERHFFHLRAQTDLPASWLHVVSKGERDEGLVFCFEWWPIERVANELMDGKQDFVRAL
ncbi:MAG TPA: NUDIX domain-containing protein [Abditibacterium sp.]|jgi:ADP-ribose pyrophosphatase YjhB (NUDIX family)